jgi:hypothetical protein
VEAVQVLEGALEREPTDFLCNLSLAALLMRGDDRDLPRAGLFLDRAEQMLQTHPAEEDLREYAVLRITFLALNGEVETARERLRQLSPERRADRRMEDLLKLLER